MIHWTPFIIYFILILALTVDAITRFKGIGQRITIFALFFYLVLLLRLCLTPVRFNFMTASRQLHYFHGIPYNLTPFLQFDLEWYLNILMTIPLGVFLYICFHKMPLIGVFLSCLAFTCFIEGNQFVCTYLFHIGRIADIDDIITNTFGGVLGFYFMKLIDRGHFRQIISPFYL